MITNSDYRKLILTGIKENGGSDEDIKYVDQEWLKFLGMRAANVGAMLRKEFPSWIIAPVCDIETVIKRSRHSLGSFAQDLALPEARGEKRIYVAFFEGALQPMEYLDRLRYHGLQPCSDGPSYLAGLMVSVPREEMPVEIKDKWIVATGRDNIVNTTFINRPHRGYLYAAEAPSGRQYFDSCGIPPSNPFPKYWDNRWAFLAEKIVDPQ